MNFIGCESISVSEQADANLVETRYRNTDYFPNIR